MDTPFWKALERCNLWQREQLPGIGTRQGVALLIWLLKNEGQARPIGELYKSAKASEPTMREAVRLFIERGLAAIDYGSDSRQRLIYGTSKLDQVVAEYRMQLARLAVFDTQDDARNRKLASLSLPAASALQEHSGESSRLAADLVNICSLYHDASIPGLVVVWKRYGTSLQFRFALEILLQMLRAIGGRKILGDDTDLPTIRPEDQKWVLEQWLPRARGAGFKVAATKKPISPAGWRAVSAIHAAAEGVTVRSFDDLSKARRWLQTVDA